MKKKLFVIFLLFAFKTQAQQKFNGLDMSMGNLSRLSDACTRSISPENFTGAKGMAKAVQAFKQKKPDSQALS